MSKSSNGFPMTGNRKPGPCPFYARGSCRYGDACYNSHDADATQHQPKSPEPCRYWIAGTCTRGSKCWYRHDVDVQAPGLKSVGLQKQHDCATPQPASLRTWDNSRLKNEPQVPDALNERALRAEHDLAKDADTEAARERANATSREEAARTMSQLVSGSIVTFGAGLDVTNLIPGFETCILRIKNIPMQVTEDDIQALLMSQRLDVNRAHVMIKKGQGPKLEARIVTDSTTGRTLAPSLDGVDLQDEILEVEMSAANSIEGMRASGLSPEILSVSWHAPSVRYVAEFVDIPAAGAKVKELNNHLYNGRRIKVEMNTRPSGRYVRNLMRNAIRIGNLPLSVTDEDILGLTGAESANRLPIPPNMATTEQISRMVQMDIRQAFPGKLMRFDGPSGACTPGGVVSARAHFSSWDDAHAANAHLENRRYGNQPVWFRLPDPMYFTLTILAEQYKAQRTQWESLSSSIKDKKACALNILETGNIVRIRLSGSIKEATGALKVRVENLARGEKVDGWHRLLGTPGNTFTQRVHSETGAYLRADWKKKSLKVYGTPGPIVQARKLIKAELERLAFLDYTVTLAWHSVGFFVREGLQQLKDILGEDNVKFEMSSGKITVSGGEEARHALNRLITLSNTGNSGTTPSVSQGRQACPICYDDVSSPHRLGCGHTYCVACLRHFVSSALESDQLPLTCLGDEARCRVPIPIPTIQQFLPPASFNRLFEAAFDAYIAKHPEEFKHCKTPDCMQIYRAAQVGTEPQTLHCPSCFSAVCNSCQEEAHDGMTCAEGRTRHDPAEQERLSDAWIASQGGHVKKCPQCSVPIEKLEGCNHMTCRCGAHICWRCMGIFTSGTIYNHMRNEHGTIYDDVPPDPEPVAPLHHVGLGFHVDIEEQRELLRQVEARRDARLQIANGARRPNRAHDNPFALWDENEDPEEQRQRVQRLRHEEERERQERRRRAEEWERRQTEWQRRLREVEERRAQEERNGGCMLM